MKKLLLLLALVLSGINVFSQEERIWQSFVNPNSSQTYPTETVLYNSKMYQVVCSTSVVRIYAYNNDLNSWSMLSQYGLGLSLSQTQTHIINDKLYIVAQTFSSYELLSYDFAANQLVNMNASVTANSPYTFRTLVGTGLDQLYLLHIDNYSGVKLRQFSSGSNSWSSVDYTSLLNPLTQTLSSSQIYLYLSDANIYAGITGPDDLIIRASKANPGVPSYYNSAGSNDGKIRFVNNVDPNAAFYLTGNTHDEPTVNYVPASQLIYQAPVSTSDINITGATPLDFSVTIPGTFVLNDPAYSFIFSNINAAGTSNANSPVYMMGEDHGTGLTDTIGAVIDNSGLSIGTSYFNAHLENLQMQHMAVSYKLSGANLSETKVLNRRPFKGTNAQQTNSGLCLGHQNEIYPVFDIYDADVEKVRIISVTSLNGNFSNLSAIPSFYDDTQNPSVSKFRIFGTPNSSANDRIIVTYSDGWTTITDTLNPISVSGSAPNVFFTDSPLKLCSNENLIELENMVNLSGEGVFYINGQPLSSTTINGLTQSQLTPNGTMNYLTNIDGCYVEAGVVFGFVNAGVATATTTPATCGSENGTADVVFVNGTSSNVTFEWSTGETTQQISNLAAGAYYYAATDEFGCHSTGFANVGATGITVTETISNVSCSGENNGSVSVVVSGQPNYTVLWSTGHSTPGITNLQPGNYEVTVTAGACQVTESYSVAGPSAIMADLLPTMSGCGTANGSVNGTFTGGTGALSYEWIGQSQTTEDLSNVGYGYYEVKVKDANNCVDTFGIQINDIFAPIISDSIVNTSCNLSNGAIIIDITAAPGGNSPNGYSWSNGTQAQNNFNLSEGSYTISATAFSPDFLSTCYSAKTMEIGIKPPLRQEICIVTVDTATTTNLVIWEKVEENVDHYNIYRENAVAGNFILIDTVDGMGESIFNDVVASPDDRSWRYKISAVNACGIEGPASIAHKTVHLNSIINTGNGSMNVYWDDYEGLTGSEYKVWRYTDQDDWMELQPSIPFGTSFLNDAPPAGSTGLDYYVEMIPMFPCTAEKSQDFNSSRSNKDRAQFSPGNGTGDSNNSIDESYLNDIKVYPNPVSDMLLISQLKGESLVIEILGINGAMLNTINTNELVREIDMKAFANGIYFVKLKAGAVERTVKVVKN